MTGVAAITALECLSMRATVIIPIWRGAPVIAGCLDAIYRHSGPALHEVICVDNASPDGAGDLVAARFPAVRLLRQPVNLGFAGGVNVGIANATGDLLVLVNQDCVPGPGWLDALRAGLAGNPGAGIAGALLYNETGDLNHAGAFVRRSDAVGAHTTVLASPDPFTADYVTGALFAILRTTHSRVGDFDEGFYPGYYEESDYCYRARRLGIETILVPGATAIHLLSGTEWQRDPLRHSADQHRSRYRFVSKHFPASDLAAFFQAEVDGLAQQSYFDQSAGRALGARETLRQMSEIVARMSLEQDRTVAPERVTQLRVGFAAVLRASLDRALRLAERRDLATQVIPMPDVTVARRMEMPESPISLPAEDVPDESTRAPVAHEPDSTAALGALRDTLTSLELAGRQAEQLSGAASARHVGALRWLRDGLSPNAPAGSWWRRLVRRWLVRPWHAISGQEGRALAAALLDFQAATASQTALQSTLIRQSLAYAEVAQAEAQTRAMALASQIEAQRRMADRFASDNRALRDRLAQLAADARARYADLAAADARLAEAITSEGAVLRGALADLSKGAQLSADHLRALELMALYDYH